MGAAPGKLEKKEKMWRLTLYGRGTKLLECGKFFDKLTALPAKMLDLCKNSTFSYDFSLDSNNLIRRSDLMGKYTVKSVACFTVKLLIQLATRKNDQPVQSSHYYYEHKPDSVWSDCG